MMFKFKMIYKYVAFLFDKNIILAVATYCLLTE